MTSERLIRVYKNYDLNEIKEHLMIWGALTAQCAKCSNLGLKFDTVKCPACGTEFRYISFMNIRDHQAKIPKLLFERPYIVLVDHDDFKSLSGAMKAKEFLK